jgi:hypothetical protein
VWSDQSCQCNVQQLHHAYTTHHFWTKYPNKNFEKKRMRPRSKGIIKDNHMPYMNSSWPESTSLWTMAWIVGLFSAHHLWKKAWKQTGKVNLQG